MAPQGKSVAGVKIVPTAFDLGLSLADAIEKATSSPEDEDFGGVLEGQTKAAHLGGEQHSPVNETKEKQDMRKPKCKVYGVDMLPQEARSVLTANLGSSANSNASSQKRRNKGRGERRKKKRKLDAEEEGREAGELKSVALKHLRELVDGNSVTPLETRVEDLKAAEGGWLGSLKNTFRREERHLQQVLESGFTLLEWDGRRPHAILDKSERVFAVLAGMPKGEFEKDVVEKVTAAFRAECESLPPPGSGYMRGKFHAIFAGVSHGGGTPEPMQTATDNLYKSVAERLKQNESLARLAGFQNQAFKMYFRKTHEYYRHSMETLCREKRHLQFPFVDSLPSCAFNLGPKTICVPHRDAKNLAFGICCITALGDFDAAAGGHLVLEELELLVKFPPGATVLIPSAVVTHSNTSIQEGERRYSFTQYASGSLFSYIENGMRTAKDVVSSLSLEQKGERKREASERWSRGLAMFPFISDYMSLA